VPMSVSRLFEPRATRQSCWRSSGPGSDVNAAGAMGCIIVSQYGRPRRAEVDSKSIDSKIVENTSFRVVCHFTRVRMACPQFRLMYRYPASGEPPDFREHGIFQMRFRTRWRRAWIRAIYPQRRQCDFRWPQIARVRPLQQLTSKSSYPRTPQSSSRKQALSPCKDCTRQVAVRRWLS
jgi:hypothetical protein